MKEEILSQKTGIKQKVIAEILELAKKNQVEQLILFGSRARGDYKERSDIDLAFRGGRSNHFILDVDEETSTLLEFDVIDLDRPLQKELLESIEQEGIVIYEKSSDNGMGETIEMTNQRLFVRLKGILSELSENEYPESYAIICDNTDMENEVLYDDVDSIVAQLHDADGTKQLPGCIFNFLTEFYEDKWKDGNADAACDLGSLYYTGRGGEQNYAKAVEYYTLAAEGGCDQAQENLGYCYYYGRYVDVDYKKAFHYFALGAFSGNLRSLYKIGDMYRNGYYVEKNEKEAFHIYSRCFETMTENALPIVGADVMMRLGDCYANGIGTLVDNKAAMKYYQYAEQLFFERLKTGDFMIRNCYDHVVQMQVKIRKKLEATLPSFLWTN